MVIFVIVDPPLPTRDTRTHNAENDVNYGASYVTDTHIILIQYTVPSMIPYSEAGFSDSITSSGGGRGRGGSRTTSQPGEISDIVA